MSDQHESHSWISKSVYSTCYFLSYGVVFPTLWVVGFIPKDNAMGHGFRDGADAAMQSVDRMRHRQIEGKSKPAKA